MKALGIKPDVEVNTQRLSFRKGDRFILCSDGFWGVMPEDEFISMVSMPNSLTQVLESSCNTIEAVARKKGNDYDNLTAAIVETDYDSKLQPERQRTVKIIIALAAVLLAVGIAVSIL